MNEIRVIQYGIGEMGSAMADLVSRKKGLRIVAAIDTARGVGQDLGEILGLGRKLGVIVTDDPKTVFKDCRADVVLHATTSFLEQIYPQIIDAVEAGVNFISIAEELGYPYARHPKLAKNIDELAKVHGVTVLGTGLNPGFIMDSLIIHCTGIFDAVRGIYAERIANSSEYGPAVLGRRGFGLSADVWKKKASKNLISGHIGFEESISMIADSLGWELDDIKQQAFEPVVADIDRSTADVTIRAGTVCGFKQKVCGIKDGQELITFAQESQVRAEQKRLDEHLIRIEGTPEFQFTFAIPGKRTTAAMAVNMIPQVVNARPGLTSMRELPNPAALMGDVSKLISGAGGEGHTEG
ncbi:MAG: NADP-binding protein [Acidiferrobacterales bacterium]